jgi:hypothetical protein
LNEFIKLSSQDIITAISNYVEKQGYFPVGTEIDIEIKIEKKDLVAYIKKFKSGKH